MCDVRIHKIIGEMLKRTGKGFFPKEEAIRKMKEARTELSKNISPSVLLLVYAAMLQDIHEIKLVISISELKEYFQEKGYWTEVDSVGALNTTSQIVRCGDIIFFMTAHPVLEDELEERVGMVYRVNYNALWVVSVNHQGNAYTTIMRFNFNSIVGIAKIFCSSDDNDSCEGSVNTLTTEPDIVTDGIVRWYGHVSCKECYTTDKSFINLKLGPGDRYGDVPWCPRVYDGAFVAVFGEFSDRTPGKGNQQWFLVKVDGYCCGYINTKFVVKEKHQADYSSGDVTLYDIIHVISGEGYEDQYDITPASIIPSGEYEIIDINLSSLNPYKLRGLNEHTMNKSIFWVRPDIITELW